MSGIKIIGTGMYAPSFVADNEAFSKIVETSDEWITTRTGIRRRHLSVGETTVEMGLSAAERALASAGITAEQIDLILFTSVTLDYYSPSASCVLQGKLGATGAIGIDLNCACAGFVYALDMAKHYLADYAVQTVLIVSAENVSKLVDYTDRSTCVLFGDGAAACVVQKAEDAAFASFLKADGKSAGAIVSRALRIQNPFVEQIPDPVAFDGFEGQNGHYLTMKGQDVYKFATKSMPEAVEGACAKLGIRPSELDLIVAHQANIRILETAAKHLNLPMDKFFVNIDEYGNTSSASVPIALCEAVEQGRIRRGDRVCFVGFGAGLVVGAAIIDW